jgi:DNA-binding LacI/PurR family transcriptional regulator
MNTPVLPFRSLPAQVTQLLRDEIARGTWREWLPSERVLSDTLQVSRKTVRKALAQLAREGRIGVTHGLGCRVLAAARSARAPADATHDVALLTPEPLEHFRPYTALWVNHLKTYLIEQGVRLHTCSGRKYFTRNPAAALERLVRSQPAGCWLLAQSTLPVQRWFERRRVPCVIAGTGHPGVRLPDVDLDHAAVHRHAAGAMLAAGHRRIVLLTERTGRAGDLASEAALVEAVRTSAHAGAKAVVARHGAGPGPVCQVLDRLLAQARRPTAILASNSAGYLTVLCALAQRGLRVPRDLSLVSRGDDPFFAYVVPAPTRYACSPAVFAHKLMRPLLQQLHGETPSPWHTRIMPTFTRGETLAPPAPR